MLLILWGMGLHQDTTKRNKHTLLRLGHFSGTNACEEKVVKVFSSRHTCEKLGWA